MGDRVLSTVTAFPELGVSSSTFPKKPFIPSMGRGCGAIISTSQTSSEIKMRTEALNDTTHPARCPDLEATVERVNQCIWLTEKKEHAKAHDPMECNSTMRSETLRSNRRVGRRKDTTLKRAR